MHHDRPIEIEQLNRFDDLQISTIIGRNHQQLLIQIVDRKTGYLWVKKYSSRKAEEVFQTTIRLFESIKDQPKTTNTNNDKEFSLHKYLAKELDWYFADPCGIQHQGMNGLARQYIRKRKRLESAYGWIYFRNH